LDGAIGQIASLANDVVSKLFPAAPAFAVASGGRRGQDWRRRL